MTNLYSREVMGEMTDEEVDRIDLLHNAVFNMLTKVLEQFNVVPEWDIEIIGRISDIVTQYAENTFNIPEIDFYPYRDEENDDE